VPARFRKRFRRRDGRTEAGGNVPPVDGEGNGIATIRELAERIGVSVATVSRVLNDYPDVSPETRAKVLATIQEMDWTPDRAARQLVTGRSHTLGVILQTGPGHPELQHPFFQEVLEGLKGVVGEAGFDLLLFGTPPGRTVGTAPGFLSRARQHRVEGVAIMGVDRNDPQMEALTASGIPCMAVDQDFGAGRTGFVCSDNVDGAALAVRHLHDLGHRRIALIAGPADTRPGVDRLHGYRRELRRLKLGYRAELVVEGDFYAASGYAAMVSLLDVPEPPTAVLAASDMMAAGALQALDERGIDVPGRISLVGFDDIPMASFLSPALTTVRQDGRRLGASAGEALLEMIAEPDRAAPRITVSVELVVRSSSGHAPAEEPTVARSARNGEGV
jgi:LacI family transcriptional regulator